MKTKLPLRIAAVLMILHAAGHTMGMLQWKKGTDAEHQAVVSAMTDHRFPFMGALHSLGDSFTGFGTACTIFMLITSALLWVISSFASTQPRTSIRLLSLLFLSLVALCVVEIIYFFPMAAIITLLATISTGVGMLALRKAKV